ncbi:MAG: hypothetical protein RL033_6761 [Pseudomonadota bacterium]|jgi:hypothetical protein
MGSRESAGGPRRWLSLLLAGCLACSSAQQPALSGGDALEDPNAARYRLQLRANPVDPGQAFRCYGQCQSQVSPRGYLECLAECPGFEVTEGMRCGADEVPPVAACFTVRQAPKGSEPTPGWVVLGVVANVILMVTLASVCASSSSQCGYGYVPPPGGPPPF